MKIEEAIVYVLAERNGGLKTEHIAEIINRRQLHVRKDGQPVTSAQVYAVVMRNTHTWRAGIPEKDRTAFVQHGIYRISRNPAFVGFDLMYIGLLVAFPNVIHLVCALLAVVMLHLQILNEEKFCAEVFGKEYDDYSKKVRRYL